MSEQNHHRLHGLKALGLAGLLAVAGASLGCEDADDTLGDAADDTAEMAEDAADATGDAIDDAADEVDDALDD